MIIIVGTEKRTGKPPYGINTSGLQSLWWKVRCVKTLRDILDEVKYMISRYEQFANAISGIYRSIQKIERDEMVKYGYKGAYAQYLAAMLRHPEGVTSVQLCEICDKDKAAVSRMVAEMVEKKLIIRESENDNMYRARLRLTDEGIRAAEYVRQRAVAAVAAGGRGLTDPDRQVFYNTLELIAANLNDVCRDGLPE